MKTTNAIAARTRGARDLGFKKEDLIAVAEYHGILLIGPVVLEYFRSMYVPTPPSVHRL